MENVDAEVRLVHRYNTGNYTHVELELKLKGPIDTLKNNPEISGELKLVSTNMGKTMDDVFVEVLQQYNARMSQGPV